MHIFKTFANERTAAILAIAVVLSACGGGGSGSQAPPPTLSIENPTSAASYFTTGTGVRLGGTVSGAGLVHVHNALTGTTSEGYVFYNQGNGTWFADVTGLGFGDNPLIATADDGPGTRAASVRITITRPLQPADLIINAPDRSSANTYWIDGSTTGHAFALYADGTGRSTTGSTIYGAPGAAVDITWTKLGPDSIAITNCPTCSFQSILRISGSLAEALAYGQVVTSGGGGYLALDAFVLASGSL